MAEVEYSRSVEGDEEYWMQNTSAIFNHEDQVISNGVLSEKNESLIDQGFQPIDAKRSNVGSVREKEANLEMRSQISAALDKKTERSIKDGMSRDDPPMNKSIIHDNTPRVD